MKLLFEDEKDEEIARLKLILSKIQEVSIPHIGSLALFQAEMRAINRWCKVALGKDINVPDDGTDINVGSMEE